MKILLIEPDTVLADIYKKALEHAGHTVAVAGGAQAAIEAADKRMPEVVILEMQLVGHSGLEFLYEFRSYSEWQNVPVIVHSLVPPAQFTGAPESLDHLKIAAYMYKPQTNLSRLIQAVGQVAQTKPAASKK